MKNDSDSENYNREFKDLQMQIYDMAALKFNGVSMFATTTAKTGGSQAVFDNLNQSKSLDNTVSVFVSADGNAGPIVSVSKALLLSALTIDTDSLQTGKAYVTTQQNGNYNAGDDITFAAANEASTINLSDISVGVFTQAIEKHRHPSSRQRSVDVEVAFRRRGNGLARDQPDCGQRPDRGRGHCGRKHPHGEIQRPGTSLGFDACPGEHERRRRADAPEVRMRTSKEGT